MRQHSVLALGLSMLVAHVAAQNNSNSSPFTIDPSKIDPTKKSSWCTAEYNTCKLLCDNAPTKDDCDPNALTWLCLCQNNSAPALDLYTQTMPTFICQQAFEDCNLANVGNKMGQDNCTKSIQDKCGKLDPATYTAGSGSSGGGSSSSSAVSSASAPTGTGSTTSGAATAPTTSTAATAATNAPSTTTSHAAAPTMAILGNGAAVLAAAGLFAALV